MRKFLSRDRSGSSYDKTWENFGDAYGEAFDMLAKAGMADGGSRRLALLLFFLCRHTIELDIKNAIIVYSASAGESPNIKGHGLAQLWNELMRQMRSAGFPTDDEWTTYCGKLVNHIHEIHANGERFRYPSSSAGIEFDPTSIELRGLAAAQWHIGMLCDAAIGMLHAMGRKS
jgi:hypothetical protein